MIEHEHEYGIAEQRIAKQNSGVCSVAKRPRESERMPEKDRIISSKHAKIEKEKERASVE